MLFQKPIIFLNKDGYNNKDEKGLCQNLMFSPTLGCLLGKYKLFGEKIFFLACKKNLYCPFLRISFYTKNKTSTQSMRILTARWPGLALLTQV